MNPRKSPPTTDVQQKPKRDPVAIILRMHIRGNASLTDTLHHISHKIKDASRAEQEGTEGALSEVWMSILGIALELSSEGQARLVSFLEHFNHHANPALPEETWTNVEERGTFAYGPVGREWASCRRAAMVLYSAAVREVGPDMSQSHASRLVNFSAFLARMTESGLMDFSPSACMAMSQARECLKSNIIQASAAMTSAVISGAAVWIIYSSHRLAKIVQQDDNKFATEEDHEVLHMISPQDWALWKDSLHQVGTMGGITVQAREHAREALKVMMSAEVDGNDQRMGSSGGRGHGCDCMMPCSWFMANLMLERKIPLGTRGRAREV